MKLRHIFLAHLFLSHAAFIPRALLAQDFQVRVYTANPPRALTVTAAEGTLRWRTCPDCPEQASQILAVESAGSQLKLGSAGNAKEIYITGTYRLRPAEGPGFSANFPLHMGVRGDRILVIAAMPIEEYVEAVLAAESGDFQYEESRKAMAVAARTYALRFRGQHRDEGFDFCNTTHCQALRWNAVDARTRSAAQVTKGEILRYGGTPAATFYHQNCGGTIAAAKEVWPSSDEPYLAGHADPYCVISGGLKWESVISVADIDRALREAGLATSLGWKTIEVASRTASGRAERLEFVGGNPPNVPISASSFRFAVDRALGWNKIRSDLYEIRNENGMIVISGRGSGHGAGFCQAGAEEMAREGKTYREILSFYYPGTQIAPLQSDAWQQRTGERLELISANPEIDSSILPIAERILKENESSVGWQLSFRVRLQVFPTMDRYRDATGEPGWVAASTRGHTIRLQPLIELQRRAILESTLRHELFHLLIEAHAKEGTPLWFREGIVLYLSNPELPDAPADSMTDQQMETVLLHSAKRAEVEKAYTAARSRIALFVRQYGKKAVLEWLRTGVPQG